MEEEVVQEYRNSLADLSQNSKPQINMLTMLAEDNRQYAAKIVKVIEAHLKKAKSTAKLPTMYLIDSIMKNIRNSPYIQLIGNCIATMFCDTFEQVDERTRQAMFKLRQTWSALLPNSVLYTLDTRVSQTLDPAWPITATEEVEAAPSPSIHVNPKFLSYKTENDALLKQQEELRKQEEIEAEMRSQLIAKQQELIRLQQQKLELELAETKAKLEAQSRELALKEKMLVEQQAKAMEYTPSGNSTTTYTPSYKPVAAEYTPTVSSTTYIGSSAKNKPTVTDVGIKKPQEPPVSKQEVSASRDPRMARRDPRLARVAAAKKGNDQQPQQKAGSGESLVPGFTPITKGPPLGKIPLLSQQQKQPPNNDTNFNTVPSLLSLDLKNATIGKQSSPKSKTRSPRKSNQASPKRQTISPRSKSKDGTSNEGKNTEDAKKQKDTKKDTADEKRKDDKSSDKKKSNGKADKNKKEKDKDNSDRKRDRRIDSKGSRDDNRSKRSRNYRSRNRRSESPDEDKGRRSGRSRRGRSRSKSPKRSRSPSGVTKTSTNARQVPNDEDAAPLQDQRKRVSLLSTPRSDDNEPPMKKERIEDDLSKLFGSEDQDYRQEPTRVNLSQSFPPQMPSQSPVQLGWKQMKLDRPDDFGHFSPPMSPAMDLRMPIRRRESGVHDEQHSEEDLHLPKALLQPNQMEQILAHADKQLQEGKLTEVDHREILRKLGELQKLQTMRMKIKSDSPPDRPGYHDEMDVHQMGPPARGRGRGRGKAGEFKEPLRKEMRKPADIENLDHERTRNETIRLGKKHGKEPFGKALKRGHKRHQNMAVDNNQEDTDDFPVIRPPQPGKKPIPLLLKEDNSKTAENTQDHPIEGRFDDRRSSGDVDLRLAVESNRRSFESERYPFPNERRQGSRDSPGIDGRPPFDTGRDGDGEPSDMRRPDDRRPYLDERRPQHDGRGPHPDDIRPMIDDRRSRDVDQRQHPDERIAHPGDRRPEDRRGSAAGRDIDQRFNADERDRRPLTDDRRQLPDDRRLNPDERRPFPDDMRQNPDGRRLGDRGQPNDRPMPMKDRPMFPEGRGPHPGDRPPPNQSDSRLRNQRKENFNDEDFKLPLLKTPADGVVMEPRRTTLGPRTSLGPQVSHEVFIDNRPYELSIGAAAIEVKIDGIKYDVKVDEETREVLINGRCYYRLGDPIRDVIIGGKNRKVFYHGPMKKMWVNGVEYEVRIDSPPQRILVGDKSYDVKIQSTDFVVFVNGKSCGTFGGHPTSVMVEDTTLNLQYDPPPKTILIDGQTCLVRFDKRFPEVVINGKTKRVRFDGPPRDIIINNKPITVQLDLERKCYINKKLRTISLGGPGFEVIIDREYYECVFNGAPREFELDGTVNTMYLPGEPPEVKVLDIDENGDVIEPCDEPLEDDDFDGPENHNEFGRGNSMGGPDNGRGPSMGGPQDNARGPMGAQDKGRGPPMGAPDNFQGPRGMAPPFRMDHPRGQMRGPRPVNMQGPPMRGMRPRFPGDRPPMQMGPRHMGPQRQMGPERPMGPFRPRGPMEGFRGPMNRFMGPGGPIGGPHGPRGPPGPMGGPHRPMGPRGPMDQRMFRPRGPPGAPVRPMGPGPRPQIMPGDAKGIKKEENKDYDKAADIDVPKTFSIGHMLGSLKKPSGVKPNVPPTAKSSKNAVDVNDLFAKLLATGIIKKEDEVPEEVPETVEDSKQFQADSETFDTIPDISFVPDKLKVRYNGVIQLLYSGTQCSSCAERFGDAEKYRQHLDWHFRQNKRENAERKIAKSRLWYYELTDWIMYEGVEDSETAHSNLFEHDLANQQMQGATDEIISCPTATGNPNDDICEVCKEAFAQFWDEDEEAWHLKDAIRVNSKTYHPVCYEDYKETSILEGSFISPVKTRTPSTELKSPGLRLKMEPFTEERETPVQSEGHIKQEPIATENIKQEICVDSDLLPDGIEFEDFEMEVVDSVEDVELNTKNPEAIEQAPAPDDVLDTSELDTTNDNLTIDLKLESENTDTYTESETDKAISRTGSDTTISETVTEQGQDCSSVKETVTDNESISPKDNIPEDNVVSVNQNISADNNTSVKENMSLDSNNVSVKQDMPEEDNSVSVNRSIPEVVSGEDKKDNKTVDDDPGTPTQDEPIEEQPPTPTQDEPPEYTD